MTRTMVLVLTLSVIAVIGSMAAVGYTAINNANRVSDIESVVSQVQTSRYEYALLSCQTRDEQNAGLVKFVGLIGGEKLEARAAKTFTQIPDCEKFAKSRVALPPK